MIDFKYIDIDEFNAKYKVASPEQSQIKDFGINCANLIKCKKIDNEEFQKNEINNMLKACFGYECNVKDKIDSCIYDEDIPKVLIEVKQLSNKKEFPKTKDDPLSKAFVQSVFYFLKEHLDNNNNEIKHIIICNPISFFIFDANEFIIFKNDSTIKKLYKNTTDGTDKSREKFYKDLIFYLSSEFNQSIKYTHFELNDKTINDDSTLSKIYQLLSLQVLLKQKRYIDSNTLNEDFYNELLHILGLKQTNKNGVFVIDLSDEANALSDLITQNLKLDKLKDFESIFNLITTWNNRILFLRLLESMLLSFNHIEKVFLDIDSIPSFQVLQVLFFEVLAKKEDSRNADVAQFSNIPYLNSSLFEKTKLEKDGKEIKFLDSKPLRILQNSILRKDNVYKEKYANKETLPFLEYLFDFLHAYNFTTTPKDIINNIKINHNKLINSAVLGLVFEKLNGYKEGSFYTPSFITSYMCKQSLEKIVLDKFNAQNPHWKAQNLEDLRDEIRYEIRENRAQTQDIITKYQALLNSIKICDPSVGSGHFLVSALNEMIAIHYKLGLLEFYKNAESTTSVITKETSPLAARFASEAEQSTSTQSLSIDYELELQNDEVIIITRGKKFTYTKPKSANEEAHIIQKGLFNLKRTIIENNLFGVDINHNSCEITKLRLWIELLKYSYYIFENGKNTSTLQTLPNIDINIKCGNSLISRFDLKDSLKHIPNINHQIAKYQKLFSSYKNADQSTLNISKQEIEAQIEKIKQTFTLTLKDPKTKQELEKAIETHITNYGISLLDNTSLLDGLSYTLNMFGNPQLSKEQENEAYISYGKIMALRKKLDSFTNGESYKNAFEWRFEFPEVLDSNGDFLGFDLVIGNPPYGVDLSKNERELYKKTYNTSQTNTAALFIFLSDRILAPNGINTLIVPKSLNYVAKWEQLRDFIAPSMYLLTDCGKAWDYVLLEMVIFARAKGKNYSSYENLLLQDNTNTQDSKANKAKGLNIDKSLIELFGLFINGMSEEELHLGIKLNQNNERLGKYCRNIRGASAQSSLRENGAYAYIGGKQINRFGIIDIKGFSDTIESGGEILDNALLAQDIVAHITKPKNHIKIIACIPNNKDFLVLNTINQLVFEKLNLKLAWAIINSKLINWYVYKFIFSNSIRTMHLNSYATDKIPIPKINAKNQTIANQIIALVDEILKLKAKDSTFDTSNLESKIDKLVYKLYNLTDEEIKIIESK